MPSTNFKTKLQEINEKVDPVINEILCQDVEKKNSELALYQCRVGGKRIRPALAIISGQMFGANVEDVLYPAAALEVLHNSTLIIDDIIDHSEFRRDEPTCWNKYGTSIAQCTSFMYIASVFAGANKVKNGSQLVDLYSKTLKVIIDGEIKDILFERSGREDENFVVQNRYKIITTEDYFEMVAQKTAVLLKTSCMAGAICADATDADIKTIGEFGHKLGIAFQVRDDILDIFGDEKLFGKKIGKDIIEKKMGNFVILSAMEDLKPDEKKVICDFLESAKEISDEDVVRITALIEKTNARRKAEEASSLYIRDAIAELHKLPDNEHRQTLEEVANYIVDRKK